MSGPVLNARRILVVDDEAHVRFTLEEVLLDRGHDVRAVESGAAALAACAERAPDVVLSDLAMPGMDGLELLRALRERDPELPVVLITARGSERSAVTAMKAGAHDYLTKPFDIDEVALVVERAAELRGLRASARIRRVERAVGHELAADSPAMQALLRAVERVAPRDVTVLVRGETGTGKELVASLLHAQSRRAGRAFVRFNCAAIPEPLAEAELFGHERGAFTGATSRREGYFARADGGTLVLDEVGELSLGVQAKLLRALQSGEVQPVGATCVSRVDVRLVASTHRDLRAEVEAGRFREDLYYRLAVVELEVPPLRARREDLPALAEALRRRYAQRFELDDHPLPEAMVTAFGRHDWPGNVRELENALARLLALSEDGRLAPDAWRPPGEESAPAHAAEAGAASAEDAPLRVQLAAFEREVLARALARAGGNQSEAARRLGVTRTTLLDKLKRYGLWRAE